MIFGSAILTYNPLISDYIQPAAEDNLRPILVSPRIVVTILQLKCIPELSIHTIEFWYVPEEPGLEVVRATHHLMRNDQVPWLVSIVLLSRNPYSYWRDCVCTDLKSNSSTQYQRDSITFWGIIRFVPQLLAFHQSEASKSVGL